MEPLVLLGVLEQINGSEQVAPSFTESKAKTNQVKIISDIRNLDMQIKHKPYPILKTNKMLLKLEGFKYAMSLNFNME